MTGRDHLTETSPRDGTSHGRTNYTRRGVLGLVLIGTGTLVGCTGSDPSGGDANPT